MQFLGEKLGKVSVNTNLARKKVVGYLHSRPEEFEILKFLKVLWLPWTSSKQLIP